MPTQRAIYSIAGDVEMRDFGPSMRCVHLVLEKFEGAQPAGTGTPAFQFTDRIMAIDVENGVGALIPQVTRVVLDATGRTGTMIGRIQRLTADHVEITIPDNAGPDFVPFSHGYTLVTDPGDVVQRVSEPFMLFGVTMATTPEFDSMLAKGQANYRQAVVAATPQS